MSINACVLRELSWWEMTEKPFGQEFGGKKKMAQRGDKNLVKNSREVIWPRIKGEKEGRARK